MTRYRHWWWKLSSAGGVVISDSACGTAYLCRVHVGITLNMTEVDHFAEARAGKRPVGRGSPPTKHPMEGKRTKAGEESSVDI
eukprot:scaffold625068_cov20-Prasinocladus_malaysianus.AAC.1